jgi:hypothetical protein
MGVPLALRILIESGVDMMCDENELNELIHSFTKLPEMYQQNILGVVRDKIRLYEMQMNVDDLRNGFIVGFKVNESHVNYDDKEVKNDHQNNQVKK